MFGDGEMSRAWPRVNLTTVADLLSDFDGVSNNFDTWEKRLRFLKATYRLDDDSAKLLVGTRLKKRAFECFRSRPEYILEELGTMFRYRESKLYVRRQFENRTWKKDETFQEYLHDKTIMGNKVLVEKDELLEYLIEGTPDVTMRDQARIQGFASVDSFLKAFERVTLRDRGAVNSSRHSSDKGVSDKRKKTPTDVKRCFNCGEREHVDANCPTRALGAKCFGCGARGHISSKCPKKNNNGAERSVVTSISPYKRCMQEVILDG